MDLLEHVAPPLVAAMCVAVVPILGPLMGLGGSCAQVGWWLVPISNTVASAITIGATTIAIAAHIAAATIATAAVDVAALLVATSSAVCGLLV